MLMKAETSTLLVVDIQQKLVPALDGAPALGRMRQAGAGIVSREMVAYEWLERAGSEPFRAVSREYLR